MDFAPSQCCFDTWEISGAKLRNTDCRPLMAFEIMQGILWGSQSKTLIVLYLKWACGWTFMNKGLCWSFLLPETIIWYLAGLCTISFHHQGEETGLLWYPVTDDWYVSEHTLALLSCSKIHKTNSSTIPTQPEEGLLVFLSLGASVMLKDSFGGLPSVHSWDPI